jgi:hypothetical protein
VKRTAPSLFAALPWNSVGPPAAVRASARSASYASTTSGSSIAPTIASTSRPGTRSSACAMSESSSSTSDVVNQPNCSARKAAYSLAGSLSRVATMARHARLVPGMRARGSVANGIP